MVLKAISAMVVAGHKQSCLGENLTIGTNPGHDSLVSETEQRSQFFDFLLASPLLFECLYAWAATVPLMEASVIALNPYSIYYALKC